MLLLCQHFAHCFCLPIIPIILPTNLTHPCLLPKHITLINLQDHFIGHITRCEWDRNGCTSRWSTTSRSYRIRVAYNRIWHCTDSISDVCWPIRARVTQTRSKGITGNIVEEAKTQTTDAVSGYELVLFRSTIMEKWSQGIDPLEVDENRGSVTKKAPASAIWRSRYSQGTRLWSPDLRAGSCNNSYKLLIAFLIAVISSYIINYCNNFNLTLWL